MKKRKGQISVEYLFILSLALAIIIPGSALFYNYSKDSSEKVVASQINRIGNNIVNTAEQMYTIGKRSWVTLEVGFPESTVDVYTVDDSELVIEYQTPQGITEAVFFTDVPIEGIYAGKVTPQFHTGTMKIKIESVGDRILLGEKVS